MAGFTPDISADVLAACRSSTADAAAALGRFFAAQVDLLVGEAALVDLERLPEELAGPGLVVVLRVGQSAALVLLSDSSGVLPDGYADPDPSGTGKLATLAGELGRLLLPEAFAAHDALARRVESIADALARGKVANGAGLIPLSISTDSGKQATLWLIWPVADPEAVFAAPAPKVEPLACPQASTASDRPTTAPRPSVVAGAAKRPGSSLPSVRRVDGLPAYAQSLLRIRVPLVVTLATKKHTVGSVIELGPGSIISFDKSCEEMLDLDIGGHPVARGEAVKVGEKFGLRITSVKLPGERYYPLGGKQVDRE